MCTACPVPRGRKEVVGVGRISGEVHEPHELAFARPSGCRQDALPRLASVFGAVHRSASVGRVQFAQRCHPHAVGVAWVQDHPTNVVAAFEPRVAPRRAVVVADVHPVPRIRAARRIHFAGADDDASRGVRGDGAKHAGLLQKRFKRRPVIDALPEPTCGVRHVHRVLHDCHVHDSAAHDRRSDVAQLESTGPGRSTHGGALVCDTGPDRS